MKLQSPCPFGVLRSLDTSTDVALRCPQNVDDDCIRPISALDGSNKNAVAAVKRKRFRLDCSQHIDDL
jgi:hypothetical protein